MLSKAKLGAAAAMLMASALVAGCGTSTAPGPTPAKSSAAPARTVTATKQQSIQLPGKGGHGDVVVADPGAHMVYVSQSPDDNVVVIDTATNTIKAVIGNVSGGTGIAYDQDYVFVSA